MAEPSRRARSPSNAGTIFKVTLKKIQLNIKKLLMALIPRRLHISTGLSSNGSPILCSPPSGAVSLCYDFTFTSDATVSSLLVDSVESWLGDILT